MDLPEPRPTDRARRIMAQAQVLLGLLAVPVAVLVGIAAAERDAPAAQGPIRAPAVLVEAAAAPALPGVVDGAVPTPARWTDPDGSTRSGLVWAEPGAQAGAVVDRHDAGSAGHPAGLLAAAATLIVGWIIVGAGGVVVRARLSLRDSASWATEWARVEPLWSGRVP